MVDTPSSQLVPACPVGPRRFLTRYEGREGAEARRALVLALAARKLARAGIGRTGRTIEALHEASLSIAEAFGWPDAVVERQHVERSKRIRRLFRRIRFGFERPTHNALAGESSSGLERLEAQLRQEKEARAEEKAARIKAQAEHKEMQAQIKTLRHTNAIAQVRLFASCYGLTLGPKSPAGSQPSPEDGK